MANWLSSSDAVIIFTGSTVQACNEAALRLFGYTSQPEILSRSPLDLLMTQQPDNLPASDRLLLLTAEAQEQGVCKTSVMARRANGEPFGIQLLLIAERNAAEDSPYYCTKWLPLPQQQPLLPDSEAELLADTPAGGIRQHSKPAIMQLLLEPDVALASDTDGLQLEMARLKGENQSLKRLQRVIRKSLERFRVLAEYSPDVIMQFDRKYRHLFVNSQVEKQFQLKAADLIGKSYQQLGFPDYFTLCCEQALDYVFRTGTQKRLDLQLPNGRWVDWFLIPESNDAGEVVSVIATARDISEQKKTEEALQTSQHKLREACEVTKLSSWEYEVAEDRLLLNQQLRDLLGIEQAKEWVQGSRFLHEFILPEELGKIRYIIRMAKEAPVESFKEVVDYRLRRVNGTIIHVLSSVRIELDEQGELIRAFGTAQDITQLRLTEQELEEYRTSLERLVETRTQELRKSEEKLADALRLANLGTWEFDPVAECFLVSDEVLEIFGTTREIEGGSMLPVSRMQESIYAEDLPVYQRAVERAGKSEDEFYTDRVELRIVRSDGEIRHLYVSIKIGKTRNFIKYYGTLQDISSIRKTEHEKDRLTAIIETTSDMVGIAAVDGQILYLNKAGKEFFGITSEESLQQKTFSNFQSQKFSRLLSRKELRHADKYGTWSGQNRYLSHDGREVHVSQVIVSHKDADGQVQCYSTILRDMSEQKKIEQDLIFKNNELDTFIYRASHDLRGPIATLLGLNQIVRYEVTDSTATNYFDLYHSQIMRLHNITVSLIELTKIKDRSCEIAEVDFKECWQRVKKDIWKLPESAEVLLHESIEPVQGFCSDAHLLQIIFYNLVENAIRYRRSEVESFARIEIQKSRESNHVVIKISDNGIGIDGELQGKIYNMFFRGTERSKGPGLGLYILKNAVEKLGGRITLYSIPYKGTTFKIELPSLSEQKG
ncbi:PAS domain S-box protein [Cesiribacter andamanensis]|uniref:histidine kinase n=1 Tax=Cesiribacter andamanensis AMV16 TaxID=1279009 RepID=M7NRX7_9BACT|nr:PAS domain S-box protein [Cesiribacter andamanensis]EMR04450.1 Phytochrome-like protein cph1 [Cesiribacter andamanensis AMV16]